MKTKKLSILFVCVVLASCFTVLALSFTACGSPKSEQNNIGNDYAFEAQYIRTDGYHENAVYPQVFIFDSRQKLDTYYNENKQLYDFAHKEAVYSDTTIGFVDAIEKYDNLWFESHQLVVVLLEERSGSIRHEVTKVTKTPNNMIQINRTIPEIGTDDMAEWHILIELDRGVFSPSDKVEITFTENE